MINKSVVIVSTTGFLVDCLCKKLQEVDFKVYIASNDTDLFIKINNYFPRFIFIENCFLNNVTDEYVNKIKSKNRNLRIIIWTASDIPPFSAARFIHAGAESFISLRETSEILFKILTRIKLGETYCPDDVEKACNNETTIPIFDVPFTERELQIMRLLRLSDVEIGKKLGICRKTVGYHKQKLFKKLGLNSKYELIKYAVENGIIPKSKVQKKMRSEK